MISVSELIKHKIFFQNSFQPCLEFRDFRVQQCKNIGKTIDLNSTLQKFKWIAHPLNDCKSFNIYVNTYMLMLYVYTLALKNVSLMVYQITRGLIPLGPPTWRALSSLERICAGWQIHIVLQVDKNRHWYPSKSMLDKKHTNVQVVNSLSDTAGQLEANWRSFNFSDHWDVNACIFCTWSSKFAIF